MKEWKEWFRRQALSFVTSVKKTTHNFGFQIKRFNLKKTISIILLNLRPSNLSATARNFASHVQNLTLKQKYSALILCSLFGCFVVFFQNCGGKLSTNPFSKKETSAKNLSMIASNLGNMVFIPYEDYLIPVPVGPAISSLTETASTITQGNSVTITYNSQNSVQNCISGIGCSPGSSGSFQLNPMVTTTYTFTLTDSQGRSISSTFTITVNPGTFVVPYPHMIQADGPVGYWRLDDSGPQYAVDATINGAMPSGNYATVFGAQGNPTIGGTAITVGTYSLPATNGTTVSISCPLHSSCGSCPTGLNVGNFCTCDVPPSIQPSSGNTKYGCANTCAAGFFSGLAGNCQCSDSPYLSTTCTSVVGSSPATTVSSSIWMQDSYGNNTLMPTKAVTAEAWVNASKTQSGNPALAANNPGIITNWNSDVTTAITGGYNLFLYASDGTVHFTVGGPPTGYGTEYGCEAKGTSNLKDNKWHHVVGVYNGTSTQIYVDSQLQGSSTCTTLSSIYYGVSNQFSIGGFEESPTKTTGSVGRYFSGNISHAAVYNKALSSIQIQNHYNCGTGNCPKVGYTKDWTSVVNQINQSPSSAIQTALGAGLIPNVIYGTAQSDVSHSPDYTIQFLEPGTGLKVGEVRHDAVISSWGSNTVHKGQGNEEDVCYVDGAAFYADPGYSFYNSYTQQYVSSPQIKSILRPGVTNYSVSVLPYPAANNPIGFDLLGTTAEQMATLSSTMGINISVGPQGTSSSPPDITITCGNPNVDFSGVGACGPGTGGCTITTPAFNSQKYSSTILINCSNGTSPTGFFDPSTVLHEVLHAFGAPHDAGNDVMDYAETGNYNLPFGFAAAVKAIVDPNTSINLNADTDCMSHAQYHKKICIEDPYNSKPEFGCPPAAPPPKRTCTNTCPAGLILGVDCGCSLPGNGPPPYSETCSNTCPAGQVTYFPNCNCVNPVTTCTNTCPSGSNRAPPPSCACESVTACINCTCQTGSSGGNGTWSCPSQGSNSNCSLQGTACSTPLCSCDPNVAANYCAGTFYGDSCGNQVCAGTYVCAQPPPPSNY